VKLNRTYQQLLGPDGTLRKDVRYFEVYGGRRSGKSHDVDAIVGLTCIVEPGHFVVAVRKVAATLKDSVFAEFIGFFRDNEIPVTVNVTDKEIRLANGSRIRCFGLDDPEKLKSLKGATIIVLEEANELTEDDFDSLDAGLSPSNYPGRIILLHNPVPKVPGLDYWYEKRFQSVPHELSKAVINEPANALILRTWYKDNAFCPEATKLLLEGYKTSNPEKYKLWALGEFTKIEGVVFDNWDIVKEVPEGIIHDSIGCGLDFGFSNDPAACVKIWVYKEDIYIKQLLYMTGLTNDMLYTKLSEAGLAYRDTIIADSSDPKTIDDLFRRGLKGIRPVHKKANYKEDLINRIRSFKIHLIEGDTDIIREFSTYSWARDKNNKQLPKLVDGDDHSIDAFVMRFHEYYGDNKMHVSEVSLANVSF